MSFISRAVVLALCVWIGSAARAENPRVNLKLEEVSGKEAIAALAKASGVRLELPEARFIREGQLDEILAPRASFNWSNVRFGAALRELCKRYHLRPGNNSSGAMALFPDLTPPPGVDKRVGLVEKNGVRVWVQRIAISTQREINFEGNGFGGSPGNMNLALRGEIPDGDAEALAGVSNLSAKDDLGNLLAVEHPVFRPEWFGGGGGGAYPDEFSAFAMLPAPHPKARKLVWVEGDVMYHRVVRPVQVEIPVPLPANGGKKVVEGVTAEVTRLEKEPDDPNADPFNRDNISVQARLIMPADTALRPRGSVGTVALRGASGKIYSMSSGGSGGSRITFDYNLTFHHVSEPVTAVVFSLVEKSEPEPLLSFRMTDIPLPGDPVFVPQRATSAPVARKATELPFLVQTGGGDLVNRILISGKPAPVGTLSLGLAPRQGDDWGGTRWTALTVGADGVARLPNLKPGMYRLIRVYRVKDAPNEQADGVWQNSEVIVEITGGKEATPPPLTWGPSPPPEKGQPSKAPPKKQLDR